MTESYFTERDLHLAAFGRSKSAAWHEGTTRWQAGKIGRLSGNGFEPLILPIDSWNRAQEANGIGVAWRAEDLRCRRQFHDAAGIHNGDSVTGFGHHRHVMGNQNQVVPVAS